MDGWRAHPGTLLLIAVSIAAFAVDWATGGRLLLWGAKSPAVWSGEWHRFVAAQFLHTGVVHLGVNMYALFIFGRTVEALAGAGRFLLIYFLGGLVGFAASLLAHPGALSVGASGAIFGLMGYTLHYRLRRLPLRWLSVDTSFAQIFLLNLAIGFGVPRIDQFAHLGGFLGGAVAGSIVGIPGPAGAERARPWERAAAWILLAAVAWASAAPLAFGARLGAFVPVVRVWTEERFGPFFVPFIIKDAGLYWLDPADEAAGWRPVPDILARPGEDPLAVGVFWRWERGAGRDERGRYTVVWRFIGEGAAASREALREEGDVTAADPGDERIFRRSLLFLPLTAAAAGSWHIAVEVDGTLQYEREFVVRAR